MAANATDAVLIETTILVDYLRRSDAAADYLDKARAEGALICSAVTKAELIAGTKARAELRVIEQLMARLHLEAITAQDSARALKWLARFLHKQGVGFHDCLLGSAALRLGIPIATLNEKHFRVLPGVKVIRPY